MSDRLQVPCVLDLVKGDLFGVSVLRMLHSTIGKRMICDLELAEDVLQVGQELANCLRFACDKVINVSRH